MIPPNMPTEEQIQAALKQVKYPGFSRDIVSFGLVRSVRVEDGRATIQLQLSTRKPELVAPLEAECKTAVGSLPGIHSVQVDVRMPEGGEGASAGSMPAPRRVPGIRYIVAVASGKGGVGKSTVSVNLACGLARQNARVGLLDCDIYGPSIPLMMGIHQRPSLNEQKQIETVANYGVKLMSIGFLVDSDAPVIWRGPMIVKTIQQFLGSVAWGELDYLLIDLPPGTGDAQLTLCQTVPLDGGLIVTTPQEASLGVVRKGMGMFQKLNVPILGIIENMSYFTAPDGQRIEIFGHGGGSQEARRQGVPFLGEIPLYTEIRIGGDRGTPVVVDAPQSPPAQAFLEIVARLLQRLPAS